MSLSKFRPSIAVTCIAMVLALPAESDACWLFGCCSHAAPACPAPACPAPVATQVNYVPQTCYRTVYSPVAVTSYRPITTADPCTGCPVTSLSPVTTYVQRPVVVPYTTYRPVVTTVQMPVAPACPCSPCATGACGVAPATTYYAPAAIAAPAPSCGCGASPAVSTAYYTPTSLAYGGTTASYYAPPATFGGSTYSASPTYATSRIVAPAPLSVAPLATSSIGAPVASSVGAPAISNYPPNGSTTIISSSPGSPSTVGTVISGAETSGTVTSGTVTSGTVTTGTPLNTYYNGVPMPGPVNFNSSAGAASNGANTPPSLPNNPLNNNNAMPPQKPTDANTPPEVPPMKPIPNNDSNNGNSTGIFKSEPDGRTTSMPIVRPWDYTTVYRPHVSLVSAEKAIEAQTTRASAAPASAAVSNPATLETDADGWHAAR